jgi:hypothetical protein
MPPGFRAYAKRFNDNVTGGSGDSEIESVNDGSQTHSGIPLPFADPAVGGGVVPSRAIRIHVRHSADRNASERRDDTLRLLQGMQMIDSSEAAVICTRRRILLVLARAGLVDLDGDGDEARIGRGEVEAVLEDSVRCADALRGEWPWDEAPRLLVSRPPWLRIKDRFRGHPEGSQMRKDLSRELRDTKEIDGSLRFAALRGNVNLYRLFLERALNLVREGGRIRMVVPDALLREKSSVALRKLMVEKNEWCSSWSFPEPKRVFSGASQGVLVLGLTVGGSTEMMTSFGPLGFNDVSPKSGLDNRAPFLELERGPWSVWTDLAWAVPKMPRDHYMRRAVLKAIGELADQPRLGEEGNWLNPNGKPIRVRVGEIDQTNWSSDISGWASGSQGVPFIRGSHFCLEDGDVRINHPGYDAEIEDDAIERSQALWSGPIEARGHSRVACQAIVNAQKERRLRWAVVPPDCVLGNSVNFLELPEKVLDSLAEEHGSVDEGLLFVAAQLNTEALDLWSRAWAANNNVNNYEIKNLPFPPPSTEVALNYALRQ